MNELQRQAYLSAMGIQLYYPRSPLAGAKASPASHLVPSTTLSTPSAADADSGQQRQFEAAPGTESPAPTVAVAAPSGRGVSSTEVEPAALSIDAEESVPQSSPERDDETLLEPGNETGMQAAQEAESGGEPQAELKFELCYYKISTELAVIDEIPHHSGGKSHSHSLVLLRAILLALGVDSEGRQFKRETFSWPLAAALELKSEPALEARKALLGFIKKRQETDEFSNLLIFAGQIDEILMHHEDGAEVRDYRFANYNYYLTITRSLRSMLAYPMLKRDTWQHLQPLRQRLADRANNHLPGITPDTPE